MPPTPASAPRTIVLRLPRTAYLAVVLLFLGAIPLAFGTNEHRSLEDVTKGYGVAGFVLSWRTPLILVPFLVAFAISRTATVIDGDGIRARALLGTRRMTWDTVRGLSVTGRGVYAVLSDGGAVRLPCARIAHLGVISRSSGGRLPEIEDAVPKPAPARRPRR